jgi:hypothetical protein
LQALLAEALPPPAHRLPRRLKPPRDLGIVEPAGGQQHDLRPRHLAEGPRLLPRPAPQPTLLDLAQLDPKPSPRHTDNFDANRADPSPTVTKFTNGTTKPEGFSIPYLPVDANSGTAKTLRGGPTTRTSPAANSYVYEAVYRPVSVSRIWLQLVAAPTRSICRHLSSSRRRLHSFARTLDLQSEGDEDLAA